MAAGDAKLVYPAATVLTVTNLHSIASSATWVAGWESALIDNSSLGYTDYSVSALIKLAAAGLAIGEIRLYLVKMVDDTTWPDVFDGSESTETVQNVGIRDSCCKLGAIAVNATTASVIYPLECPSVAAVFGGNMPKKFLVFITHSTGANLAASGNQVVVTPSYLNIAAA